MPSDRDRLSFDPRQRYLTVVAQSGRVVTAADTNEAHEIFLDERRAQTLDIVGPFGTPDGGYAMQLLPAPNRERDFRIGAGTMYVGGQRAVLPSPISYLSQPDWLLRCPPTEAAREYIYLLLVEHEISAVEDETLKDVALGGPDTSQRLRFMQRIVRVPTTATNCADALAAEIGQLSDIGWDFSSATMRLASQARLRVSFEDPGSSSDPCEPTQTGGYLGADNQLIRVRTTGPDRFVWGYDNASPLYRVDVVDDLTVRLQAPPVDAFHFPDKGQAVELLASAARLANGTLVAANTGQLFTLTEAYNPDARTIRLPMAIPPKFLVPNGTPRLFLRVWQEELPFTPNTPVSLPGTGIQVTFNDAARLHAGDHWAFAVRPATPVAVYPHRYLDAAQPPEGPRRWFCPLAIIAWHRSESGENGEPAYDSSLIDDCRRPFDNLVELTAREEGGTGCCTIQLRPQDVAVADLSQIIASLPTDRAVCVCFTPGTYEFAQPVTIQRSQISLVACPGGVTLRPKALRPDGGVFANGIFVLSHASDVEISGLRFDLEDEVVPDVRPYGIDAATIAVRLQGPKFMNTRFAIGIRLDACSSVSIRHCEFHYSTTTAGSTFAAGILAAGNCRVLQVENCTFQRDRVTDETDNLLVFEPEPERYRVWLGFVYVPSIQITGVIELPLTPQIFITGRVTESGLDAVRLAANHFEGLTAAAFIQAGPIEDLTAAAFIRAGPNDLRLRGNTAEIRGNTAERCYSGFWILGHRVIGTAGQVLTGTGEHTELGVMLSERFMYDLVLQVAATIAYGVAGGTVSGGSPFTSGEAPGPFSQPPSFMAPPLGHQFNRLWNYLRQAQLAAWGSAPLSPHAATFVSGNRVLCPSVLEGEDVEGTKFRFSGPGLVLWGDVPIGAQDKEPLPNSQATIDANIVETESREVPSMAVMLVTYSAVTGNVVKNFPRDNFTSLLVYSTVQPGGPVAITGNTCRGSMKLPPRWEPFNNESF